MAQPIIVTAVTTESCASLGPGENHGACSYSRRQAVSSRSRAGLISLFWRLIPDSDNDTGRGAVSRLPGHCRDHGFRLDDGRRTEIGQPSVDLFFDHTRADIHKDLDLQRLWHLVLSKIPRPKSGALKSALKSGNAAVQVVLVR